MHILDIVENSIRAKADMIKVSIVIDEAADLLTVNIDDNGCGMSKKTVKSVTSPFVTTRTTRKVGLGIPLFASGCENTGGSLSISSKKDIGTNLTATYRLSHIDRPPLGDIAQTMYVLTLLNPQIDFVFTAKKNGTFLYDTRKIKAKLDGMPITHPDVLGFIHDYLREQTTLIFGGYEI